MLGILIFNVGMIRSHLKSHSATYCNLPSSTYFIFMALLFTPLASSPYNKLYNDMFLVGLCEITGEAWS